MRVKDFVDFIFVTVFSALPQDSKKERALTIGRVGRLPPAVPLHCKSVALKSSLQVHYRRAPEF